MWADTKGTCCLIPLVGKIQNRGRSRERKQTGGCWGPGEGDWGASALGQGLLWGMMRPDLAGGEGCSTALSAHDAFNSKWERHDFNSFKILT